ncbi:hypothetical protein OS493_034789 [Desmophyllum pertusum]|uniref:Uncharacterized protein n=1 Tax=Desmophyllum pertusum TaxID=174260 RepID=A0A9W9YIR9_9CNID|nr:hypothetical protein OS493_034789 [Desmophyllum pertusum]
MPTPQSTRNSTDSPKSVAHDVSRLDGCLPNKAGKEREENGIIQDKGNDRSLNYNLVDASEERKEIIGQHTSEEAEEKKRVSQRAVPERMKIKVVLKKGI